MDYVRQIQDLQDKTQKNKEELIRLEEKNKNLKEDKEKLVLKLKELGIESDNSNTIESMLGKQLNTLEENLKVEISKIEESLK